MEVCWKQKWDINEPDLHLFKPVENTKFLLVSWRMSGSEFVREFIRENFPSASNMKAWGKTHIVVNKNYLNVFKTNKTKIIFSIADPRDVASHVRHFQNGSHLHPRDYSIEHVRSSDSLLLMLTLNKIENLLSFYDKHFGNDMLVLKYEDAIQKPHKFLHRVSSFLDEKPLFFNDKEKHDSVICKKIGVYNQQLRKDAVDYHIKNYSRFYKHWGYIE